MLWNCIIILLFANIVKLLEVTIPFFTQKKGLQAHSLHTRVSWQLCRNKAWVVFREESRAGENRDLYTVPCWQGKGSTKDTNKNSSGTPFVFSSVPCYKECIFCLTADPLFRYTAWAALGWGRGARGDVGGFGVVFFLIANTTRDCLRPSFWGYCSVRLLFLEELGSEAVM